MKHRDLIFASAGVLVLALGLAPSLDRAATPRPPPQIDVEGGGSATTTCAIVSASTYSTNFNSTENPISEGGKWINGKAVGINWNNAQSVPGKAYASVLSGNPNEVRSEGV